MGNDQTFVELQATVVQLKVVNNAAERGIALVKAFNSAITTKKSKNNLLQVVEQHKKDYLNANKSALSFSVTECINS